MRDGFMLGVAGANGLAAAQVDRVLVVRRGVAWGYYDLSANEGIAQLNSHIDLLVNETIDPESRRSPSTLRRANAAPSLARLRDGTVCSPFVEDATRGRWGTHGVDLGSFVASGSALTPPSCGSPRTLSEPTAAVCGRPPIRPEPADARGRVGPSTSFRGTDVCGGPAYRGLACAGRGVGRLHAYWLRSGCHGPPP